MTFTSLVKQKWFSHLSIFILFGVIIFILNKFVVIKNPSLSASQNLNSYSVPASESTEINHSQWGTPINLNITSGYEAPVERKENTVFAAALAGTDMPAKFKTDNDGHLIINQDIRLIFDYFLTLKEENNDKNIWILLDKRIRTQLTGTTRNQAFDLFKQYMAYKEALPGIEIAYPISLNELGTLDMSDPAIMEQLENRFSARQTLREEFFTHEVKNHFFDEQEQYDRYHINRLAIHTNKNLSPEMKQRQLDQIKQQLPSKTLEQQRQINALEILNNKIKATNQKGISKEEHIRLIDEFAAEMAGEEAMRRYQLSQSQTSQWNEKRQTFLQQRNAINHNTAIDQLEKENAIRHLQASMGFSQGDILRLHALDRIEG